MHMRKSLPPNVIPPRMGAMPYKDLMKLLIECGMEAKYTLPHGGEVAVFESTTVLALERALQNEAIKNRCIEI